MPPVKRYTIQIEVPLHFMNLITVLQAALLPMQHKIKILSLVYFNSDGSIAPAINEK